MNTSHTPEPTRATPVNQVNPATPATPATPVNRITWPTGEPETIILAGDWHCDLGVASSVIRSARDTGVNLIIQLGDFGLWTGQSGAAFLDGVEARATKAGVPVAWIDGNHEDHDFLEDFPVDPVTGLRPVRENVWHVPRGSRWDWAGLRFAALGGGTSLDRPQRIPGHSWWSQEAITTEQAERVIADGTCDVLLTHDCPAGVPIPGITPEISRTYWPEMELRTAWAHADLLAEVAAALQPAVIYHGHYHIAHTTEVDCFAGRTVVTGLGDNTDHRGNRVRVTPGNLARKVAELRADSAADPGKSQDWIRADRDRL